MRSTFAELPLPGHQPQRSLQGEAPSQICSRSLAFLLRHPFCANGSQRHTPSRFKRAWRPLVAIKVLTSFSGILILPNTCCWPVPPGTVPQTSPRSP